MLETVLYIVLTMASLLPFRGERDIEFRTYLAEAIISVTDDIHEQLTLVKIARYESGYRRNVARCEVVGDHGTSYGTFQLKPIERGDKAKACGTLKEQAQLALDYIHRAAAACPQNKGAAKLNIYTSGRCEYGIEASKLRWGGGE